MARYRLPHALTLSIALVTCISSSGQAAGGVNNSPEFSASVSGDIYSQIQVIDDIDGDGKKDMVFGATDGKVHLFSAAGTEITAGLWPKFTGGPITAPVTVADLDGDGRAQEVLTAGYDHKLYAIDVYGREIWTFNAGGAIQMCQPKLVQMDSSGNEMILLGSRGKKVFSLDTRGRLNWEVKADGTFSTTIESSDLDGDGKKEIVAKDDEGKIHVFNTSGGKFSSGWPVSTVKNGHWPYEVSITDLDGDGNKEVMATDPNKQLMIFNKQGTLVKKLSMTGQAHSAPRVEDVDGDGKPDFIYGDQKGNINVIDLSGQPLPGFPYQLNRDHFIYGTPQFADIDGDGESDIIYTAFDPNGKEKKAGYIQAINRKGRPISGYPRFIGKSIAPITLADLDRDGYIEIIAAGGIGFTDKQLHVIRTQGKIPVKIAIMGSEVRFD